MSDATAPQTNTSQSQQQEGGDRTLLDDLEAIQRFHDEQAALKPFISPPEPITSLEDEFKNGNITFVKKARWLATKFKQLQRTRGDGDCFYRSLGFLLVLSLLQCGDPNLVKRVYAHLDRSLLILEQVGYERSVTEDFWEPLRNLLSRIPGGGSTNVHDLLDRESLLAAFNDPETTNSIVVFLRLCLSAHLKLNEDRFSVFLFALDSSSGTGEPPTMDEFRASEVEPVGKEADHLQIAALCDFLQISLDVAYFSRSDPAFAAAEDTATTTQSDQQTVDIVEFRIDTDASQRPSGSEGPLGFLHVGTSLYRPGHYDLLIA
ncbi:hypothetical protein OC846_003903 [Tilletia horrida]|uniref:ubiquitinyl hydrolase 1 n=1 Tax=Tilletia horrida TaxID=155126 RepID=A0AAN6GNR1_9BASI|nr:hypothetical protein OC846_003903 [Tilletia horrida]KAK0553953.1 hypothetical protein OC845_000942 [Tilletia horrida]KAK0565338.1 hypothetical protein OC861_003812 [Tilletia horrida]